MKRGPLCIVCVCLLGLALVAPRASAQIVLGESDGDHHLFFYEGGSPTGESLMWDDSLHRFSLTDNVNVAGLLSVDGMVEAAGSVSGATLLSLGAVYVNHDGPDAMSGVYFYDGGSPIGENLVWDDAQDDFVLSDDLYVLGTMETQSTITGVNLFSNGNLYANYDGPDANSAVYFYNGGSPSGESLMWDEAEGLFTLSDDFWVSGSISTNSNDIRINSNGPDGDAYLHFYEDGSATGEYLLWDDSADQFILSDALATAGTIQTGSTEATVLYNRMCDGACPTADSGDMSNGGDLHLEYDLEVGQTLYLSKVLYMEGDSSPTDGDQTIYFADGGGRGSRYIRWDDGLGKFDTNGQLRAPLMETSQFQLISAGNPVFFISRAGYGTLLQNSDDVDITFLTDGAIIRHITDYDNDTSQGAIAVWHNNGGASSDRRMELTYAGYLHIAASLGSGYTFTDIAERFVAAEPLQPGELVQVAADSPHGVVRASEAGSGLLGVVSANPGMVLGGTVFSEEVLETGWDGALAGRFQEVKDRYRAKALEQTDNGLAARKAALATAKPLAEQDAGELVQDSIRPAMMTPEERFRDDLDAEALRLFFEESTVPVALAGRVPVKVSAANGAIRVGDAITAGPEPGVGVKATGPGFVVGTALEPLSEGAGKILVFVNRSWFSPDGVAGDRVARPSSEGGIAQAGGDAMGEVSSQTQAGPAARDGTSGLATTTDAVRAVGETLAGLEPVIEPVEPGDVLVADRSYEGWLRRSEMAADPAVVGVVTGADGVVLGDSLDRLAALDERLLGELEAARAEGDAPAVEEVRTRLLERYAESFAPVAMSGVVRCKTDASYAPIGVGDLLTTSPTPGHAMRASSATSGTILGKALESLDNGIGSIRVLVMLR